MKIHIDTAKCAGCGQCHHIAPTLFYLDGYHARTLPGYEQLIDEDELLQYRLIETLTTCPADAITLEIDETDQQNTDTAISFTYLKDQHG